MAANIADASYFAEMNMLDNSLYRRRAQFIAFNVAALGVLFGIVVAPVFSVVEERDERVARMRSELTQTLGVAARAPLIDVQRAKIQALVSSTSLWSGASAGAIDATIQARVQALCAKAGAQILSIKTLPLSMNDGARFQGSQLEVSGAGGAIRVALQEIENNAPLLIVTELELRAPASPRDQALTHEPSFLAKVDIYGPVSASGSAR